MRQLRDLSIVVDARRAILRCCVWMDLYLVLEGMPGNFMSGLVRLLIAGSVGTIVRMGPNIVELISLLLFFGMGSIFRHLYRIKEHGMGQSR